MCHRIYVEVAEITLQNGYQARKVLNRQLADLQGWKLTDERWFCGMDEEPFGYGSSLPRSSVLHQVDSSPYHAHQTPGLYNFTASTTQPVFDFRES